MGCKCNCLNKNPESNNEMIDGKFPSLGLKENHKDKFYEIININTENDDYFNEDKNGNKDENNIDKINNQININNNEKIDNSLNQDNKKELDDILENLKSTYLRTEVSRNNPRRLINYDSSIQSKILELSDNIFEYFNEVRTKPGEYQAIAEEHNVGDIIQKVINSQNPRNNLIINTFFNLLLSSYINDSTNDVDDKNKLLEQIEKEERMKNYDKKIFIVDGDTMNSNEVVWKLIKDNKDIAYDTFFSNSIECIVISCQPLIENQFNCFFLFLSKKNN